MSLQFTQLLTEAATMGNDLFSESQVVLQFTQLLTEAATANLSELRRAAGADCNSRSF